MRSEGWRPRSPDLNNLARPQQLSTASNSHYRPRSPGFANHYRPRSPVLTSTFSGRSETWRSPPTSPLEASLVQHVVPPPQIRQQPHQSFDARHSQIPPERHFSFSHQIAHQQTQNQQPSPRPIDHTQQNWDRHQFHPVAYIPPPYGQQRQSPQTHSSQDPMPSTRSQTIKSEPSVSSIPTSIPPPNGKISMMPPPRKTDPQNIEVKTKFPTARIKRIMQADEDVGKLAQVAPVAMAKALELFMIRLISASAEVAKSRGSKRVQTVHMKTAVMRDDQFDNLREIVNKVPDGPPRKEGDDEDDDEGSAGKGRKKSTAAARKKSRASDDDF